MLYFSIHTIKGKGFLKYDIPCLEMFSEGEKLKLREEESQRIHMLFIKKSQKVFTIPTFTLKFINIFLRRWWLKDNHVEIGS